jgi:hypothetical protein
MTKLPRFIAILLTLALWTGGCFREVLQVYYRTGIVADSYHYGDLYRLSNLPQFRDPQQPCPTDNRASDTTFCGPTFRGPAFRGPAQTQLYIIGDSFTEPQRVNANDFRASHYHWNHWDRPAKVQIDPAKRNVLLLESVERHFREHLSRPVQSLQIVADTTKTIDNEPDMPWPRRVMAWIQAEGVEERLETVLFGHEPFLWLKERKSAFVHRAFGRVGAPEHPLVSVSRNGQHLLYGLDTDSSKVNSSFAALPDAEVAALVDSLNAVRDRFRRQGFSEVYLSIIPNKTSIVAADLGAYNHLIERVQQHPALRLPVVDSYAPFRAATGPIYALGDSHWNCAGRAIWLQQTRATLGL